MPVDPQLKNHRNDIDGLRALAVLPVLFFHADFGFKGGFVGVDIFFVISGFLISSIILKEIANNTFSLAAFWERRIRRILPALAVVVLATMIGAWFLFLPEDFASVGKSAVAQAALLANVFFWRQSGYFADGSETKPLLHTWSLAVEEQFYLLLPLGLLLLVRVKWRERIAAVIATLTVVSFVLSIFGSHLRASATFFLLPTRAWELLLGTLLALSPGRLPAGKLGRELSGWLGLALILASVFFYDRDTRFPGLAALPPCLGTILLIGSSATEPSMVGRLLGLPPLVFVGLISYSLYLWHWPLFMITKYVVTDWSRLELKVALLIASVVLATLSWWLIETPIRKRALLPKQRQIFWFGGSTTALLLLLGFVVVHNAGFPSRFPTAALAYAASKTHRFPEQTTMQQALAGEFIELGVKDTNAPIKLLLWGDSHAAAIAPSLQKICHESGLRGVLATHAETAPVLGYASSHVWSLKPAFNDAVFDFIARKRIRHVILAARWSYYPASVELETHLQDTVKALKKVGAKVYLFKDVPNHTFDVPRAVAVTAMRKGDLNKLGLAHDSYEAQWSPLTPTFASAAQAGAIVLDPAPFFWNSAGVFGVIKYGQVLYSDDDHLTTNGACLLQPLFGQIFQGE